MSRIALLCLFALAAPAGFAAEEVLKAWAVNRFNLGAEFRTVVDPTYEGLGVKAWSGGIIVDNEGVFHRFILDRAQKIYVGYDVRVQEGPDKTLLVLTIEPFTLKREALPLEDAGSWTSISLVDAPRSQTLRLLESVALDLLVKSTTGQRVVEYITLSRNREELDRPRQRSPPRAFRAEDAMMELHTPRVLINGTRTSKEQGTAVLSGSTIGLHLKDRGRFLIALLPHEDLGFQRAGRVEGSTIEFQIAGDTFRIECRRRIAPGLGTFHVYVLHDPAYRASSFSAMQNVEIFATGDPANFLKHEAR